jgi:hypothetical protein
MPGAHYNNIELFRKLHQKKAKDSGGERNLVDPGFGKGPASSRAAKAAAQNQWRFSA